MNKEYGRQMLAIIGEILDLSRIRLALQDGLISIIKLATQKPFR